MGEEKRHIIDLPSMLCEEGTNGYGSYISANLKSLKL